MSRVKVPEEKKRLSLRKDHRTLALEGNKSFRSAWPLKKALANRRLRHADAEELAKTLALDPDETPLPATAKSRRSLKKQGVMSLDQAMRVKHEDLDLRWNARVLGMNPAARESAFLRRKPKD